MGSFVLRVGALIALLAIPILGTSYSLVSSVSADIKMASIESAELTAFIYVIDLLPRVEAVHRDLESANEAAERRDRAAVTRAFVAAERAYDRPGAFHGTHAVWERWHAAWLRADRRRTIAEVDRTLDTLQEIGNELDDDSPLEVDPNFAVQNLVALVLRQTPRSIVAIRHTADEVRAARGSPLSSRSIERIAASRAIESQPMTRLFSDIPFAIEIEPELRAPLTTISRRAQLDTRAFETRVDHILSSLQQRPGEGGDIERLAQRTIDTQIALWQATLSQTKRLVLRRHDAQISRRRIIVALSLVAVVLGTLALTFSIRHMARRDRVELESAKLEGDKLRAELQQISTERALRLQEAQFRSVFENADLGIVIFERSGAIAQYNAAVTAMLGRRLETILARRLPHITEFESGGKNVTIEELYTREDGSEQWLAFTFSAVYDDGTCQMVILLLRDTTEEKMLHQGLVYAANHDGLTKIANRAAFDRELQSAIECGDKAFALMFIDLDKFKPINDTFGHAAGDQVLITTAERLRAALGSNDVCARLGGDEFAVLVRGGNDLRTLASIAARIGGSIASPISFRNHLLTVTASIGIAIFAHDQPSGDTLKLEADRALYCVKESGGNGHFISVEPPSVSGALVSPAPTVGASLSA